MWPGEECVNNPNPCQGRSFKHSYGKNVKRSQDFCQYLVARISFKKAFLARKALNKVKSKPKRSFLVKSMEEAAFSWHETTRILSILPILKTHGKFVSYSGNSANLFFLLRNIWQGTWKFPCTLPYDVLWKVMCCIRLCVSQNKFCEKSYVFEISASFHALNWFSEEVSNNWLTL